MAMIRCTCIYRPTDAAERDRTGSMLTVSCRDPHCPAVELHETRDRARAVATQPLQR